MYNYSNRTLRFTVKQICTGFQTVRLFRICLNHCFGLRPKVAVKYENWNYILEYNV